MVRKLARKLLTDYTDFTDQTFGATTHHDDTAIQGDHPLYHSQSA